jgi:hypothetical protein
MLTKKTKKQIKNNEQKLKKYLDGKPKTNRQNRTIRTSR